MIAGFVAFPFAPEPHCHDRVRVRPRTPPRSSRRPRGHAGNPMTDNEVEAKFRRTVEPKYGKDRADRILARCWDLENLTGVTDLVAMFD